MVINGHAERNGRIHNGIHGRVSYAAFFTVQVTLPSSPLLKVGIGMMRALLLQPGPGGMRQEFQTGYPGTNWVFGLDHLRMRFLRSRPSGLPEGVDFRLCQPLVPLLIRSFQLARDILLGLPLGDHVAIKDELYGIGLRAPLGLLVRFKGGMVWRFRCGLEAMKLALDPEGAVQRNSSLRDDMELPLLNSALHCMKSSIGGCRRVGALNCQSELHFCSSLFKSVCVSWLV